jgi:hypothetical protein
VLRHEPIKRRPRNVLQETVQNAILMPHGVDPFSCPEYRPDARNRLESTPCNLSTKTQPDSRGTSPRIVGRCTSWECDARR